MQAKELAKQLREGNHVLYMGRPRRCDIETIHAISKCYGDTFMYQPMLIDDDHFYQLSFTEKSEDTPVGKIVWFEKSPEARPYKIKIYKEREFYTVELVTRVGDEESIMISKILFIHELENLYFALTRSDLLKSQNAVLK